MNHSQQTRLSLIGRLHDPADSEAWNEFVQIYQPMILRIVQKRNLQYADAVEVTQEVLGRVAKAISGWDPDPHKGSFRGWLYRITRNLTIDHLRRQRNQPVLRANDSDFEIDQVADPQPNEADEFQKEYERQLFNWAATKVQPAFKQENWRAFWLTTIENKTVEQVSTELKMAKGQVYVARSRVMSKIAAVIRSRMEDTF